MGGLLTSTPTYSGGTVGSTIPGQSTQQNSQQMMQLTLKGGQTLSPAAAQAAQQGYLNSNNAYVDLNSPQARQQALSDTQAGSMQNNYNDLAQQLAAYDNATLKPQFAGQNPGMPPDIQPNGDVTWGNVSYLTPGNAGLPAAQGIFNANPAYALSAQNTQQNSILALLNTLNDSISKETQRGYDIHGGKLKSAAAVMQGFSDILDKNMALEQAKLSRSASQSTKSLNDWDKYAQQIKDDFLAGKFSKGDPQQAWGQAWTALQALRSHLGLDDTISDFDIDNTLGGSWNPKTGESTRNATPEALKEIALKGLPAAQQNAVPGLSATISNAKSARDEYNKAWQQNGLFQNPLLVGALQKIPGVGDWIASTLSAPTYNYIKNVQGVIGTQVAKGIGGDVGALANKDIERAQNELAQINADPAVGKQRLDKAVMRTTQALMRITKDKVVVINPTTKDKVQVDTPDELEQMFNKGYTFIP